MRARGTSFFASTTCSEHHLFLLDFRGRFLVILALELLCGEAVCLTQIPDWDLMKITNFVRLLIASSSKG